MPNYISQETKQILLLISTVEPQLECLRELINEEIQFTPTLLFQTISDQHDRIDFYHFLRFIDDSSTLSQRPFEHIIKFYSQDGDLSLNKEEFSRIFLSKNNELVRKITVERQSDDDMGQKMELPKFVIKYCQRLILQEHQLHEDMLKICQKQDMGSWIESIATNGLVTKQRFSQICQSFLKTNTREVEFDCIWKYIAPRDQPSVSTNRLLHLLTLQNGRVVSDFVKSKQAKSIKKQLRNSFKDPFLEKEFLQLIPPDHQTCDFSLRQLRSIQKHLTRQNNPILNIQDKIIKFSQKIEKQVKEVCSIVQKILEIEMKTQKKKISLFNCTDFDRKEFFHSFSLDCSNRLIPSCMQFYLKQAGVCLALNIFFPFFKKYASNEDGKFNLALFAASLNPLNARQIKQHGTQFQEISFETKKKFISCLVETIKNEAKIEALKGGLSHIDLRDIFGVIDCDGDGFISKTDMQIVWRKFMAHDLQEQSLRLLWGRMGNNTRMLKYDQFVRELAWRGNKSGRNQLRNK